MNTINNQEQQEVDVNDDSRGEEAWDEEEVVTDVNDDSWGEEDIPPVSDELLLAYYKVVFKGKDIVMALNNGFPQKDLSSFK